MSQSWKFMAAGFIIVQIGHIPTDVSTFQCSTTRGTGKSEDSPEWLSECDEDVKCDTYLGMSGA